MIAKEKGVKVSELAVKDDSPQATAKKDTAKADAKKTTKE